jgi:hypothetical protein
MRQFDQFDAAGSIKTEAPESPTTPFHNPRTGETIDVPAGVDPDFAYNPGKALLKALADAARS